MLWPVIISPVILSSWELFSWTNVLANGLMRSIAYDSLTMIIFTRIYIISTHSLIWEIIGDGHFATCLHFFYTWAKVYGRAFAPLEDMWNKWLQLPRSRIEHLNSVIKSHAMFSGDPYRGWVRNLKAFVNISLHGAALEMRVNQRTRPRRSMWWFWFWSLGSRPLKLRWARFSFLSENRKQFLLCALS